MQATIAMAESIGVLDLTTAVAATGRTAFVQGFYCFDWIY